MILATGAAVSANLAQLVSRTKFVYSLIRLPEVEEATRQALAPCLGGLWALDGDGVPHDLGIASVFMLKQSEGDLFRHGTTLFAAGAVSDYLLKQLARQPHARDIVLIARDFTKFFVTPETLHAYLRSGARLQVLQQSRLVAVTLNPTSPRGYTLRSAEACAALGDALGLPVYDIMQYSR